MNDYTFTLTEQEANLVIGLLAKASYETVFQLITKLQQQAQDQTAVKPADAP